MNKINKIWIHKHATKVAYLLERCGLVKNEFKDQLTPTTLRFLSKLHGEPKLKAVLQSDLASLLQAVELFLSKEIVADAFQKVGARSTSKKKKKSSKENGKLGGRPTLKLK